MLWRLTMLSCQEGDMRTMVTKGNQGLVQHGMNTHERGQYESNATTTVTLWCCFIVELVWLCMLSHDMNHENKEISKTNASNYRRTPQNECGQVGMHMSPMSSDMLGWKFQVWLHTMMWFYPSERTPIIHTQNTKINNKRKECSNNNNKNTLLNEEQL